MYFFAPWCGICRSSIDNLDHMLVGGDVAWATAVALDFTSPAEVQAFVDETGISLPVLLGSGQAAMTGQYRRFPPTT